MSDQDKIPNPSFKNRIKTHLPTFAFGIATGAAVTLILRQPNVINITSVLAEEPGTVLLSKTLVNQIKEIGEGMTELEPGLFVDIINWSHPKVADKASK